jgi:hypothetical protein
MHGQQEIKFNTLLVTVFLNTTCFDQADDKPVFIAYKT